MIVAQLDFGQTVATGALNALFTAIMVGGIAAFVIKRYENRAADRRLKAEELHDERLKSQEMEHQTRAALRETYAQFLVAQRRSRQASIDLAEARSTSSEAAPAEEAFKAHSEFIDLYHRLNLDASQEMWIEARGLRHVLDDMLECGRRRDVKGAEALADTARDARQNLERSFRIRLGYQPLQKRRPLGKYDKLGKSGSAKVERADGPL